MNSFAFLLVMAVACVPVCATIAQDSQSEKEVRTFLADYERAVPGRDIAFLERALSDDYVFSSPSGRMTNRAQALQYFRQQKDNPEFKSNSLKHENVKVRVVGNMALVTNDWTSQTTSTESASAEPTTDKGRHTGVLEKRNGRWMVIAEHDSEQIHDEKWMVSGVLRARREYNALLKRLGSGRSYGEAEKSGDIAALSQTLAAEYTSTNRDGVILDRTQDLQKYKTNQLTIASAELLEQNVRTIDNSAAVETGKIRHIGKNAGTPFDVTTRYTTTWAFYDGRWQITADHASAAKQ
ncbi:MAG: nuclear transport factor 2 family protein [Gemmatimonadaceae bacterium]